MTEAGPEEDAGGPGGSGRPAGRGGPDRPRAPDDPAPPSCRRFPPFLRRFARGVDRTDAVVGAGLRWLVLVMVLVGAYNALARYGSRWAGVNLSSNALNELQWYLFSVIFLLGAAYGLLRDAHVRVDVLYGRLPSRWRAGIDLAGTLLFLLPFCVVMLVASWPAVRNSWVIREVSPDPGGLARYPIKALILVSFALLLLQGVSRAVKATGVLVEGGEYRPGTEEGEGEGGALDAAGLDAGRLDAGKSEG